MEDKEDLTDTMIRNSFNKTGANESYYSIYEAEAKRCYDSLMKNCPNDDDNIESSLSLTDDYIRYYVEEAEKGHCCGWCDSVAKEGVTYGNSERIYVIAYNNLESEDEKNRELDIHINSLSNDPIFKEKYKSMFKNGSTNLMENSAEYTRVYYSLIKEGKSEIYAHAYAYVSGEFKSPFCDVYAEAFELATQHGMDSSDAYCFGYFCAEACDQTFLISTSKFVERYHEQWQKEFYLKVTCDNYRREENREIDSSVFLYLKKQLGL